VTSPSTIAAGLSVTKWATGWLVAHTTSRLPLHTAGFASRADAGVALAELERLGIDWQQPADTVRATVEQLPGGSATVERILTPPDERERQRRLAANSTRYLRALEGTGERVLERTSYGLAGTAYEMSCGCHRTYNVQFGGPDSGDPREELTLRCGQHADLTIEPASTDRAAIRRETRQKETNLP
jgi:hypothetical protein